jgi:hypothetical protein
MALPPPELTLLPIETTVGFDSGLSGVVAKAVFDGGVRNGFPFWILNLN